MAETSLPEGTDTIINDTSLAATGEGSRGTDLDMASPITTPTSDAPTSGGIKDTLRTSGEKLRSTASDRAYGFVGQGIERSSGALSNVSAIIADTAANLDERLGSQYGDYARSAAQTIERAAASLSAKDPEELFEDARGIVRKSPGIALAGAAILGFALVRIVKSGLDGSSTSTANQRKSA